MSTPLIYVPIFRVRQEELKVLKSFNFGESIYPCLEIIKELDRMPNNSPKKAEYQNNRKEKTFEEVYIPLIKEIKAKQVFIDLPVHFKPTRYTKRPTLIFIRKIVSKREKRTEYLKKLMPVASKVIPVISTYSELTGERGSLILQENEIRPYFKTIAFRTFYKTFPRDIQQIKDLAIKDDYIIMDWEDMKLDLNDGDITDIIDVLQKLVCHVIIHRNHFPKDLAFVRLESGKIVETINNNLLEIYPALAGGSFSDYVGIKKDDITEGGVISPGFIFYDAVENNFYGFRYKYGSHKKGGIPPELIEFETTIIPAVISSDAARRMKLDSLDFLGLDNFGWRIIKNIELGLPLGETGKNQAKFKRISMEHYMHCIKTKIDNGDFD
jgi:hypothetical protein